MLLYILIIILVNASINSFEYLSKYSNKLILNNSSYPQFIVSLKKNNESIKLINYFKQKKLLENHYFYTTLFYGFSSKLDFFSLTYLIQNPNLIYIEQDGVYLLKRKKAINCLECISMNKYWIMKQNKCFNTLECIQNTSCRKQMINIKKKKLSFCTSSKSYKIQAYRNNSLNYLFPSKGWYLGKTRINSINNKEFINNKNTSKINWLVFNSGLSYNNYKITKTSYFKNIEYMLEGNI